jgi:hypothetical protein
MRLPAALIAALLVVAVGCTSSDASVLLRGAEAAYANTDSMGALPRNVVSIRAEARSQLVENSAATSSATQPGVFFTINDSGNDPLLFALDTTGADRGMWRVAGAPNVDWEAASMGPCSPGVGGAGAARSATPAAPATCVYIGDVGDNNAKRATRVIYKVVEPTAQRAGFTGDVTAVALVYRYSDGPHDVEAMYVAPNGDTYLITKRRLRGAGKRLRPALVFVLKADAWRTGGPAVAALVDSLPIVPGSAPQRQITDAALSPDARHLAVRTYRQVFVFATDTVTGRVLSSIPPGVCNTIGLHRRMGEGLAWFGQSERLLLTSEGRESPMYAVDCPMPRRAE